MSATPAGSPPRPAAPTAASSTDGAAPAAVTAGDLPDGVESPTLRAAAARVARHWRDELADALDDAEVLGTVAALARAIETPADAEQWAGAVLGPDAFLRRRLFERLRAEVVREWAGLEEPPDGAEMLRVLDAFERVRTALEPDWSQYFASRLLGPDGLELVVELAHDLRSPLTSILFLSETLRRGQSGDVNDIQRRQLGIIYSAALGLISVASDVIELARGGDRLTETENSPFSVTEVMESVRDIVQPLAEEKGLGIRLLPPPSDQRVGHPVALSRVLLNLTTNALKFTDEGFVEIVARQHGVARIEFSVRDTGNGIEPDVLANLYQPFRRTRARSGYGFSGSGLGLAISRKLVEAMGSELRFETRPEWGTRFFFELDLPSTRTL